MYFPECFAMKAGISATYFMNPARSLTEKSSTRYAFMGSSIAELDAGILDHLRPLGRFFFDDRGKFGRRVADRLEPKLVEFLAYLGHRPRLCGFGVDFVDDVLGRT